MENCYHCGNSLENFLLTKIGRQDSCSKCGRDLRCCSNCEYFDKNSHWECREVVSEHVLDKEKANFCDYFKLSAKAGAGKASEKPDLLSAAEALFKKK